MKAKMETKTSNTSAGTEPYLIHGEAVAGPVDRRAHATQLPVDIAAVPVGGRGGEGGR